MATKNNSKKTNTRKKTKELLAPTDAVTSATCWVISCARSSILSCWLMTTATVSVVIVNAAVMVKSGPISPPTILLKPSATAPWMWVFRLIAVAIAQVFLNFHEYAPLFALIISAAILLFASVMSAAPKIKITRSEVLIASAGVLTLIVIIASVAASQH